MFQCCVSQSLICALWAADSLPHYLSLGPLRPGREQPYLLVADENLKSFLLLVGLKPPVEFHGCQVHDARVPFSSQHGVCLPSPGGPIGKHYGGQSWGRAVGGPDLPALGIPLYIATQPGAPFLPKPLPVVGPRAPKHSHPRPSVFTLQLCSSLCLWPSSPRACGCQGRGSPLRVGASPIPGGPFSRLGSFLCRRPAVLCSSYHLPQFIITHFGGDL